MSLMELKKRLKQEIGEFVKDGGNILQTVDKLPYGILLFQIIFLEKKEGKKTSVEKIHHECGYPEYNISKQPLNIPRFKQEIEAHIKNGGTIDDGKEDLPYYDDFKEYIKKEKRNGNIITIEDVHRSCGHDRKSREYSDLNLCYIFNEIKDQDNYIDKIRKTKKGENILDAATRNAFKLGLDLQEYLCIVHGVRLKETRNKVDIIEYFKVELQKFANKYGKDEVTVNGIREKDPKLEHKLRNLSRYFPFGKVTESDILKYFGYNVENQYGKIDETYVLKELEQIYLDRIVTDLTKHPDLEKGIIKASVQNNQNAFDYLKSKGFIWETRKFNIATEFDDKRFNEICEIRKKLLIESDILNNEKALKSEQIKEFDKIIKQNIIKVRELDRKKKPS